MAGLFGAKAPQANAYAQGLLQTMPPETQNAVNQYAAMPAQPPKRKFDWLGAVGALGDSLAMYGGLPPAYAQAQQRKQAELAKIAEEQRQRSMARDQFMFEQDYKRNNPMPVNNDTVNDFNWYKGLSPEDRAIYAQMHPQYITTQNPDGTRTISPMPSMVAPQAPSAPVGKLTPIGGPSQPATGSFPAFSKAIIGQESGGRYGIPNAEGSGAMGNGQIMPDTARTLATRLGLPYRPDLLAGSHPEAQTYQDALTNAALQEAWNYGGGDARKAAYYYFAGPNQKGWGPKTRQYGNDILRRMGVR